MSSSTSSQHVRPANGPSGTSSVGLMGGLFGGGAVAMTRVLATIRERRMPLPVALCDWSWNYNSVDLINEAEERVPAVQIRVHDRRGASRGHATRCSAPSSHPLSAVIAPCWSRGMTEVDLADKNRASGTHGKPEAWQASSGRSGSIAQAAASSSGISHSQIASVFQPSSGRSAAERGSGSRFRSSLGSQ